jgi:deoxyribose-phosphate aldolase
MMINLGRLKMRDEIKAVAETIAPVPLKVILEVSRLTDDEIRRGSESAVEGGAAFVKTGTGWTGEATTLTHIRIINSVVQDKCRIKASGGIRNLRTVKAMISVGVARFGINTGVALELMKECALSEAS